jgi:hypothetical protein
MMYLSQSVVSCQRQFKLVVTLSLTWQNIIQALRLHTCHAIAQQRDTRTIDDDEVAVLSPPSYRYLHLTDSLLTIAPHKALKASFVWKSPFRADLFAVLIKIQENQSQPNDMKKIQGYHEDLQQKRTSLSGPCTVLVRTSQSLSQEQTTITAD